MNHVVESLARSLTAIQKDMPVDRLCYNYSTNAVDTPAWKFREERVREFLKALEDCGLTVSKIDDVLGGLA